MKYYNRLVIYIILGYAVIIGLINLAMGKMSFTDSNREYWVSINRIKRGIEEFENQKKQAPENLNELTSFTHMKYPYINKLIWMDLTDQKFDPMKHFFEDEGQNYTLFLTQNCCYKISYDIKIPSNGRILFAVDLIGAGLFVVLLMILFYVRRKIIVPFYQFSELPYELSKGNLTMPLKENKNRFFGRFIWGMDLLRENLEENKKKELGLQKEKKMLLLSLSHDIKTPLSAIKLYSKALLRNLYQSEVKRQLIAENIEKKADEIEGYISEIVKASNEDFLTFEVHMTEFYIEDVLKRVQSYYEDKMALNQIDFQIAAYSNCLIKGDPDRLTEVIQNVIENAIKYGDGHRIWLECERETEEYIIHIHNTGCTMSEKELPHIFDSFFRGENAGKKPGSGLGLYICRKLMHQMEGEILANIKQLDGDSIMTVHIVTALDL